MIGMEAFSGCTRLTEVTLPDTFIQIGMMAFAFCPLIERIYYSGTEDDWRNIKIGTYNDYLLSAKCSVRYVRIYSANRANAQLLRGSAFVSYTK